MAGYTVPSALSVAEGMTDGFPEDVTAAKTVSRFVGSAGARRKSAGDASS